MFCPRCHRAYETDHKFCPYDGETLTATASIDLFKSKNTQQQGSILGGRYDIRGFIGKGAMARVYLAEDMVTREPVAVKILEQTQAKGPTMRERFLREAKAVARIGHENIIKILDVGLRDEDGAPYLVLEFLFGESIGDLLRREGSLGADITLPILSQAAAGLAAAHRAGIIHRDVKPDNIFLVGEPGDPYAVKLLDFGLAKLEAASGFTQAGVAVGTLEYMAPEQVVTDKPDARTDVYGLGVVMYRMFTGHLPFHAKEDAELLAHQLLMPTPPPSRRCPELDHRTELVILTAMRKRPENRYPSMDGFLDDLERLMGERAGDLIAERLANPVDVYVPKSPFAKNAARYFYKKLGMESPAWKD
jgi:eukaryotic-like serine/threonine-protein kinase